MLQREAYWIKEATSRLSVAELSPLLNVGSATAEFREKSQPWIERLIFSPLRERGVRVWHLDLCKGDGVDLSGDLADDTFVASLQTRQYQSLLCCNLLEHVPDPQAVCAKLEALVPPRGYLIITVPHKFPYHPDPIDTMFRPTPAELSRLFPHCQLISGCLIECGSGWDYVGRNPGVLLKKLTRRLKTAKEHGGIQGSASFFPWLLKRFHQTCVVLRKYSGAN